MDVPTAKFAQTLTDGSQRVRAILPSTNLVMEEPGNFRFADDPPDFQRAHPADSELTRPRHPTLLR